MRVERRFKSKREKPIGQKIRGAIFVAETTAESAILDELFGTQVGSDGLIGTLYAECRLSDGYGEHYIYIKKEGK